MISPAIFLAIPCLGLSIIVWTVWRCVLRRPRPVTAAIEIPGGLAAIFLLLAANSALIFADRTVFASSRRGGPLTPSGWIYPGVVAFYLFLAGAFCGAAIVLWFQRRHAGSRARQLSRHHKCRQATGHSEAFSEWRAVMANMRGSARLL